MSASAAFGAARSTRQWILFRIGLPKIVPEQNRATVGTPVAFAQIGIGFGWGHQDRLNQPYQREPLGGGTLPLAGGFRRIFVWPFSIEGREGLHPGPGKTPCAQNVPPGI